MSTSFDQFDLAPTLVQTVADRGYETPTPIQRALIPAMLAGRDVVGQAQTGTGKTAAFALPLLHKLTPGQGHVQALVLTPTRELAKQVAEAVYIYGADAGARVLPIYGGDSIGRQIRRLQKGIDVVVGTPGRLLDLIRRRKLDLSGVETVVLDEADEMLSMGFIDDIESILSATPSERQTAFFSATLPQSIQRLADRHMRNPETCRLEPDQRTADTIDQRYCVVRHHERMAALLRLLQAEPTESVIVFARTRKDSFDLAAELQQHGYRAGALNGAMDQHARNRMLDRFRNRRIDVLVGTDVASRGLDIDHISHVVNYELPRDPEVYVHRVGRTGRAGSTGVALTLITNREQRKLKKIERYTKRSMTHTPLPTDADLRALRDEHLADRLTKRLADATLDRERAVAAALVADGHDPLDVAAAALQSARQHPSTKAGAKGSPRAATPRPARASNGHSQDRRNGRRNGRSNGRSAGRRSHEQGMVRLTLDAGKASGARPGHVVSTLSHFGDIPGGAIGKITIENRPTLVDVPADLVDKLLAQSGNYKIKNQRVQLARA